MKSRIIIQQSFHAFSLLSTQSTRFPTPHEFESSEISQTLRDIMENLNRLNTLRTNLKIHIILTPTEPRIGTGHASRKSWDISEDTQMLRYPYRTPNRHRTRVTQKLGYDTQKLGYLREYIPDLLWRCLMWLFVFPSINTSIEFIDFCFSHYQLIHYDKIK